jgi:GNAT superfamily N-acetyltransferase
MIQLKTENYCKVTGPLRKVTINHLFARTVVEQKMDGEVYVNDPNQPSTFYVKHQYGMSLLFGRTDNIKFNKQLTSYLLNQNNTRKTSEWLQVYPSEWNDQLGQLLDGKIVDPTNGNQEKSQVIKWSRVNFRFNRKSVSSEQAVPAGLKLVRTDAVLFDQISGLVVPSFFWRNRSEFAENAIGFSLIANDGPVSTAFASFIHDRQLEIGIETRPEFRGQGLAQLTCSALIDYCRKNDFEPVWSCRLENTGSFRLAQKLGFEPTLIIPYYQLPHQNTLPHDGSNGNTFSGSIAFANYLHKI